MVHEERKLKDRQVSSESGSVGALAARQKTRLKGPKCYGCLRFRHIHRNCPECTQSSAEPKSSEHLKPIRKGKEPVTVKEAMSSPEREKWKYAMEKEIKSIKANEVWELVELPKGKKTIGCKWSINRRLTLMGLWKGTRLVLLLKTILSSTD